MRKSRKGAVDAPQAPSSPPPSPKQETSKPPLPCYRCGRGIAKELLTVGQKIWFAAFCSPACAVDHALQDVQSSFFARCQEHNRWRNSFGKCAECEARFAQANNLATVQADDAQADEKGVENVK